MARDPYRYFRIEARDLADQLGQSMLELEREGSGGEVVPRLLRLAHTLKGAARVVRLPEIADHAHTIEDLLGPYRERSTPVPRESIESLLKLVDGIADRISSLSSPEPKAEAAPTAAAAPEETFRASRADIGEIDELLDGLAETSTQVGSLRETATVASRARRLADQLGEQIAGGSSAATMVSLDLLRTAIADLERQVTGTHQRVDRELRQVRDAAEQLRLVPAQVLFPALERAARDSGQVLGKQIGFVSSGGEIRLDAQAVRLLQDAVLQLVRNAVAHGVELPSQRTGAGKPPAGLVRITVLRRGRRIVFRCEDDGRGIDIAALRAAVAAKGRTIAEIGEADSEALVQMLLAGGVSTSPTVSEVAGRGIGMDIVRDAMARLGAKLEIETHVGRGTRFDLIVPASMSSVEALTLETTNLRASLPLSAVRATLRLDPSQIHRSQHGDTIVHGGEAIPLVPLGKLMGQAAPPRRGDSQSAVIVVGEQGVAAIGVGRIPGTGNIVFRTLPELAPTTALVSGASLDADGNPLLMLDPDGIVAAARNQRYSSLDQPAAPQRLLVVDDSLTTRMLEQSILESAGYVVDVAVSAEEGLARVRSRDDYLLVLCDVEMPGMDGFGFVSALRADPKLSHLPAILVTSRNAPEDKRRGRDVGAQDYVVKSEFDQAELLGRIRELVA